jgi:hypothetical protein
MGLPFPVAHDARRDGSRRALGPMRDRIRRRSRRFAAVERSEAAGFFGRAFFEEGARSEPEAREDT